MKLGAIVLFGVMFFAVVALVNMNKSTPSAFVVQPSKDRVLGYCPVSQAGLDCYIGGREGVCTCRTTDERTIQFAMRDNCACLVPSYIKGVWAQPY